MVGAETPPAASVMSPSPVVVACLEELDSVGEDLVHEPIGLIDAARPDIATEMLEMLRLTDAAVRVPDRRLHQVEDAERRLPVGIYPIPKIFEALPLQNCRAFLLAAPGPSARSGRAVTGFVSILFTISYIIVLLRI